MSVSNAQVAALTLVGCVVHSATSWACSPPPDGIEARAAFPPAGAAGVPLNAQVVVVYRAGRESGPPDAGALVLGSDLELRRQADGEPVPFNAEQFETSLGQAGLNKGFVLRPRAPLAPLTSYQVLDRRAALPCGRWRSHSCTAGDLTVISSFTTGEADDGTAPPAPADASLRFERTNRCASDGCCGPFVAQNYVARWTAPVPAGSTLFDLHANGTLVARLLAASEIPLTVACQHRGDPNRLLVQPGMFQVRAVDWAGNQSGATGVGTIPASACENATGGCSLGGGRTAPASWALLAGLGAAGLCLRRRRRR